MIEGSLERLANAAANDYSAQEEVYRRVTGGELVRDPYGSARHGPPLTRSVSVVIPAWNARETLEQCLIGLEQSSLNRRYPELLEVVVVDDGSSDGTWELLRRQRLGLRLVAVRQGHHHSRAQAQNTGIAVAGGDVVVACDADMILAPFALEELVKRHQVLDGVMLIGFRGDIDPGDPRLRPDALRAALSDLLPPFERDVRLSYPGGGWPESLCRETDHLKRLGGGRQIETADGVRWNLAGMVYGALFSLRRSDWLAMDGYDERFHGWGCEDTLVGARARALGSAIVPVYGAAGWHVAHGDRSPHKWREFTLNRRVFQSILRAPFAPGPARGLGRAKARIADHFERTGFPSDPTGLAHTLAVMDEALADPDRRGKYLHGLGRFDEAAAAFATIDGTEEQLAWAAFDRGKALRAGGRLDEAAGALRSCLSRLAESPWPPIELALTVAGQGRFGEARELLERARRLDPFNPTIGFVLGRPRVRHLERAAFFAHQGDHALAVRDFEAALLHDSRNATSLLGRASARAALQRLFQGSGPAEPAAATLASLPVAARTSAHPEPAVTAERLRAAADAHPLPLASRIVAEVASIPGWLSEEEAELLVALVLRAAGLADPGDPPRLVEIGSHCGRTTVLMGLTLRGLGRSDARIISIEGPDVGPAPDGRPPRQALRANLARCDLNDLVTLAPEEEPCPAPGPSHLLLVDGRHDEAGVREDLVRYAPGLASGGLLVFHDYAAHFPDVVRCVDELLEDPIYDLVARAGTLVALIRRVEVLRPIVQDEPVLATAGGGG